MMSSLSDLGGDDPDKFFRRSSFDVTSAYLWRWHACRVAYRDMNQPPK